MDVPPPITLAFGETIDLEYRLSMTTIAMVNIKGGVGKTTAAVNIAHVAAREGSRTLLWDLDPQGASTFYLGLKEATESDTSGESEVLRRHGARSTAFDGLDLIPARSPGEGAAGSGDVDTVLDALSPHYTLIVLDCPPGLTPASERIFAAADALVVPTIPTPLSMRTLEQLRAHLDRSSGYRPLVMPFLSMVDRRRKLHRELARDAARDDAFLAAWVPYASPVERMGVQRGPISEFARGSAPARAFELLWTEIEGRLSGEHATSLIDDLSDADDGDADSRAVTPAPPGNEVTNGVRIATIDVR